MNLARIKHPRVRHLLEASQNRAAEVKPLTIPAPDAAQLWLYIQAIENANVRLQGLVPKFINVRQDAHGELRLPLMAEPNPRMPGYEQSKLVLVVDDSFQVREAVFVTGKSNTHRWWLFTNGVTMDVADVNLWCEMPGVPK